MVIYAAKKGEQQFSIRHFVTIYDDVDTQDNAKK
jgi:hypothetical protein